MPPGDRVTQLHRSVYDRLRASIFEGRLKPGERVPSTRTLATQLGLSRGTVDLAYAILAGEGYIVSHGARGTFVSPALPPRGTKPLPATDPPQTAPDPQAPAKLPFWVGLPAIDLFPRKIWSRLLARDGRGLSPEDFRYPNRSGDLRLKHALVSYLSVSRGIACTPDQIVITGGYQGAIGLVCRLLLSAGDKVWTEDPGYHWTHATLRTVGAQAIAVPVDENGLSVTEGLARARGAPLCIVTPSNQFPLGVALSLPRRLALLDWAATNGSWIVEDDYDSEFYYRGRLLPALKALDHADRVFYVGTFSKTLFPGLRLGYLVIPKSQAERFRQANWALDGGRSSLEQIIVADFITEGYFARHLQKMRSIYAARRAATVAALAKELGSVMRFDLPPGGLHVIGRLADTVDDVQLADRTIEAGVSAYCALNALQAPASAERLAAGFHERAGDTSRHPCAAISRGTGALVARASLHCLAQLPGHVLAQAFAAPGSYIGCGLILTGVNAAAERNGSAIMRSSIMLGAGAAFGAVAMSSGADATSLHTLYQFSGTTDGGAPTGNLVAGRNGVLYGVTQTGGASGNGTVFRLDSPQQGSGRRTVTTLYSFAGGSDASDPNNLTMDAVGNLYGTSNAGGGSSVCTNNGAVIGCGTVFELSPGPDGGWSEQVIYAFVGTTDGQAPKGVSFDKTGNLYGFGFIGGTGICHFEGFAFNCGTAFELSPVEGAAWNFSVIYNFKNDADSNGLYGPPLIDAHGALYGETEGGGPGAPAACAPSTGCGEVFKLSPRRNGKWTKQAIWTFNGLDGTGGANALVSDWAGNIYGMTNEGGPPNPLCPADPDIGSSAGCGVAYELSPPANGTDAWTYQTVWDFKLGPDSGYPFNASITQAGGRLFTTSSGPYPLANSYGAIVEFLPPKANGEWKEKTLFTFSNDPLNEAQPESSLFWLGNRLYGTAAGYGTAGSFGTVFRINP